MLTSGDEKTEHELKLTRVTGSGVGGRLGALLLPDGTRSKKREQAPNGNGGKDLW